MKVSQTPLEKLPLSNSSPYLLIKNPVSLGHPFCSKVPLDKRGITPTFIDLRYTPVPPRHYHTLGRRLLPCPSYLSLPSSLLSR